MRNTFLCTLIIAAILVPVLSSAQPCQNIQGQVVYLNDGYTPLYGVNVQLRTAGGQLIEESVTDYQGRFGFCQQESGDYLITITSDRPAGGINAVDALQAAKHYIELISLTGLQYLAADLNGSGYINSVDALLILKRYVEFIPTFIVGDWLFEADTVSVDQGTTVSTIIHGLCYGDVDASFIPEPCSPLPSQANAGPDQTVQVAVVTLAADIPSEGIGNWTVIQGVGGVFQDPADPQTVFTGLQGTVYSLVWSVSTLCTTSTDTVFITLDTNITCPPCPGLPIIDYSGQTYHTILIGDQCWLRENLNIGVMVISTTTMGNHSDCADNGIVEKYCYDNDPVNCEIYGGLYDWHEMMGYVTTPGGQGICPAGWHIPLDQDWCELTTFLDATVNCNSTYLSGISVGVKMKEEGTDHWFQAEYPPTNESCFTSLGAGYRQGNGVFNFLQSFNYLWSSDVSSNPNAYNRYLYYNYRSVGRGSTNKNGGLSVRCIKDE